MPELSYPLYDTFEAGTTAGAVFNLFQSREGSSATITKAVTNSRGNGTFPSEESYRVDRISVMPESDVIRTDLKLLVQDSFLEFTVNERTVFVAPLRMLMGYGGYSGEFHEITNSLIDAIGFVGNGYMLQNPIEIPKGTSFRVSVTQTTALGNASQSVKVILDGVLRTP